MADIRVPMSGAGWAAIGEDPEKVAAVVGCARSFRRFLDYWTFLDQETGKIRILGDVLWPAQEEFVRVAEEESWVFFLKARKLGETTIECAWDGWVARFRDANARVHLFSRRDDAAQELLTSVKFGLKRLPEWMRLPVTKDTSHEFEIQAGDDDRRLVKAYPADEETAVEATCTHGHVDEWARMRNPRKVWQAIEPSMAGTCHFVTTGLGPTNWTSGFWRKCIAEDAIDREGRPVRACFIGALERPDRTAAWLRAKRAGMDERAFLQEFPLRWEDALSGGGAFVFKPDDVDQAGTDFRGLSEARAGRKYVKAWDIGRHQDAAVGVCLDVTDDVHDVVAYVRLRESRYPVTQAAIETMHRAYPGLTAIEKNSAGEAVLENLDLPDHELEGFTTSKPSKARIIQQLKIAVQGWLIKWDPAACAQLDGEVRGYQEPDDNVVQDSVMAIAIAEEFAPAALRQGRVRGVLSI